MKRVILHIDAADQFSCVYVNRQLVTKSINGYLPIVVDIKPFLKEKDNEIIIQVIDKLDHNYPYGKQRKDRGGMWYTPVSGIWQSVWIEAVPLNHIESIKVTPTLSSVHIEVETDADEYATRAEVVYLISIVAY